MKFSNVGLFSLLVLIEFTMALAEDLPIQDKPAGRMRVETYLPEVTDHWWNPDIERLGYKLGYIIDADIEGILFKTLEGKLKLGKDSSQGSILDSECYAHQIAQMDPHLDAGKVKIKRSEIETACQQVVSPWNFSSLHHDFLKDLQKSDTSPVLLYYRKYRYYPITQSDSIVEKVIPVDPHYPLPRTSMNVLDRYWFAKNFHYKMGFKDGRVVDAVLNGVVRDTYELLIQLGDSGNNFMRVSVTYRDMFDFIVECMASGKLLRIYYLELFGMEGTPKSLIFGYQTDYRVYQVDVLNQAMEIE